MKKNQAVVVALIVLCALMAVFVVVYLGEDREGPALTVDTSKVRPYSKDQSVDILKGYVKAVDKKDGDVSDSIIVEQIYVSSDLTKANIIYAARDHHNNITKLTYTIDYAASNEEIAARDATVQTEQETTKSASNASDNKESTTKKETESSVTQKTSVEATTEAETVAGGPKLVLTSTEDTIAVGSSFNIMKYVSEITDDKDSADVLSRRIVMDGTVNTAQKGTYNLEVYCTDTDRNQSNHVTFTVHVE